MFNLIVKNALQAFLFGGGLTALYYFNDRFGSPADMGLLAKTFVTYVAIFFVISTLADIIFKKHKK